MMVMCGRHSLWKVMVAIPWHTATIAITITLVTRNCAMRQKPSLPAGAGLSQSRMPAATSQGDSGSSQNPSMRPAAM